MGITRSQWGISHNVSLCHLMCKPMSTFKNERGVFISCAAPLSMTHYELCPCQWKLACHAAFCPGPPWVSLERDSLWSIPWYFAPNTGKSSGQHWWSEEVWIEPSIAGPSLSIARRQHNSSQSYSQSSQLYSQSSHPLAVSYIQVGYSLVGQLNTVCNFVSYFKCNDWT